MNGDDRKYFEQYLEEKFTNLHKRIDGISDCVIEINGKILVLPCDRRKWQGRAIGGLYWAFMIVIIGGIVLGLWVKATVAG